ncbi:hypothetical protein V5F29_08910 [Xanthobacter aminoxidans]|uniref:hypothetical protein n=1 Tax=Xanthobacter aminoxidans TaxID=186280 RepID=UPI003727B618
MEPEPIKRLMLNENVVARAVGGWFENRGFTVKVITSRQRGYDIDATHQITGQRWVLEAKGSTSSKPETRQFGVEGGSNTAYLGTSTAFHNAVAWTGREDLKEANIGIAIPETEWFNIHSYKLHPACKLLGISIFRVNHWGEIKTFSNIENLDPRKRIFRPSLLLEQAETSPKNHSNRQRPD